MRYFSKLQNCFELRDEVKNLQVKVISAAKQYFFKRKNMHKCFESRRRRAQYLKCFCWRFSTITLVLRAKWHISIWWRSCKKNVLNLQAMNERLAKQMNGGSTLHSAYKSQQSSFIEHYRIDSYDDTLKVFSNHHRRWARCVRAQVNN